MYLVALFFSLISEPHSPESKILLSAPHGKFYIYINLESGVAEILFPKKRKAIHLTLRSFPPTTDTSHELKIDIPYHGYISLSANAAQPSSFHLTEADFSIPLEDESQQLKMLDLKAFKRVDDQEIPINKIRAQLNPASLSAFLKDRELRIIDSYVSNSGDIIIAILRSKKSTGPRIAILIYQGAAYVIDEEKLTLYAELPIINIKDLETYPSVREHEWKIDLKKFSITPLNFSAIKFTGIHLDERNLLMLLKHIYPALALIAACKK